MDRQRQHPSKPMLNNSDPNATMRRRVDGNRVRGSLSVQTPLLGARRFALGLSFVIMKLLQNRDNGGICPFMWHEIRILKIADMAGSCHSYP